MFIYLGRLARRPILGLLLLVTSVVLLGVCLTLFVIGHWAF
jgi:CHASE2 domain-containing sensor protein